MEALVAGKTSDGKKRIARVEETNELRILVCGMQENGTITPIRVDSEGRIVLSS